MDKAYIREQNFHIATEDEDMEIRRGYKVKNRRTWLKFLGVSVVLVIIGIIFQIIAHRISPWLHSNPGYYEKIYIVATIIFVGFNLLSYVILKIKGDLSIRAKRLKLLN